MIQRMSKLQQKIIREINFANMRERTTKIYKEKGTINIDTMEEIFDAMASVAKKQKKEMRITRIYVQNGEKRSSYASVEEFLEKFQDYYQGRVKNPEKFYEFMQVDITTSTDL